MDVNTSNGGRAGRVKQRARFFSMASRMYQPPDLGDRALFLTLNFGEVIWPAPIEWSGGDVSLGLGAVPARAERLGRIVEPDARA
jgi:hypothetical protein